VVRVGFGPTAGARCRRRTGATRTGPMMNSMAEANIPLFESAPETRPRIVPGQVCGCRLRPNGSSPPAALMAAAIPGVTRRPNLRTARDAPTSRPCRAVRPTRPMDMLKRRRWAASPYGLLDMAGNVWEWTADAFPKQPGFVALRGGGWATIPTVSVSATAMPIHRISAPTWLASAASPTRHHHKSNKSCQAPSQARLAVTN